MIRPRHTLAMPNVIVHPPEEEQPANGPWCYFDAEHSEDLDTQTPSTEAPAREELIMLRGNEPQWTDELDDFDDEIENAPGNDSEVVEVMKLKKHTTIQQEDKPQKSSLKSRASRAFRSIKSVASRGSSSARKDAPSSVYDTNTTSSIPLPGRSSVSLFSIFQVAAKTPEVSVSTPSRVSSPTPNGTNTMPYYPDTDDQTDDQAEDTQATSRSRIGLGRPSSPPNRFATRNFSRATLHRIFSFSSEKDSVSTTTTPRMSRDAVSSSSSALSEPQTPIDSSPVPVPSPPKHTITPAFSPEELDADVSYELRLDSFHFESLSFDLDNF